MCERLLNLQEIYVSGQNICIEVYGNSVGTITPIHTHMYRLLKFSAWTLLLRKKYLQPALLAVRCNKQNSVTICSI